MATIKMTVAFGTIVLVVLASGPTARADTVILRDGRRITGDVVERGAAWIEVAGSHGAIRLRRDDVARIVEDAAPPEPPERRTEASADADASEDVRALLAEALRQERAHHDREAKALYARILALEPGHELARRALGYLRVGDEWLTREQLAARQGLVRHGGRWVSPKTRDLLVRLEELREQAARERLEARRDEHRSRREERRARIRAHEQELARRRRERAYVASLYGARGSAWSGSYFLDYTGYYGWPGWYLPWSGWTSGLGGHHGGRRGGHHGGGAQPGHHGGGGHHGR